MKKTISIETWWAVAALLLMVSGLCRAQNGVPSAEWRWHADVSGVDWSKNLGAGPPESIARAALQRGLADIGIELQDHLGPGVVNDVGYGAKIVGFGRKVDGVPVYGERAVVVLDAQNIPQALHAASRLSPSDLKTTWASAHELTWPRTKSASGLQVHEGRRWWFPLAGQLVPAVETYETETDEAGPQMYAILRSLHEGSVLKKTSVTDHATFAYRVYADEAGRPYTDPRGHTQPHPTGVPDGWSPASAVPQQMIEVDDTSVSASGPWLPTGATETVGNNIDVFFNSLLLPNGTYDDNFTPGGAWGPGLQHGQGDFRAQAVQGVFDYVYDPLRSPSDFFQRFDDPVPALPNPDDSQLNAKIVHVFYMGNVLHDMFYEAGFDEAAGNAQQDNFGRGGIAGDRMIVHASSPTTFIFTPGDGQSPVMTLGLNDFSDSSKDASLDWSLFSHEWAHYMVRRLVGGGVAHLENNQGGSLNEGWADFVGAFVNLREEDFVDADARGFTSTYAVGGYFNDDYGFPVGVLAGTAPPDNYFYGIRRWPLGASNPFTFRHIEHGASFPGDASDFYDWKGRSRYNSELHTAGEIWAAALWDCFRGILTERGERGFDENKRIAARYLVAGMLATPPNPTFTEARDGLLSVIRASDAGDYRTCRAAFAARGMGAGAVSPERYATDHAGVVESFEDVDLGISVIDATVDDSLRSFDDDGILDQGETGRLRVVVRNTGFEAIRTFAARLRRSDDVVSLDGMQRSLGAIVPGQEAELEFRVRLRHGRHYDPTDFVIDYVLHGTGSQSADMTARQPDRSGAALPLPGAMDRVSGTASVIRRTHFDLVPSNDPDTVEQTETFGNWRVDEVGYSNPRANARWRRTVIEENAVYGIGEPYARYAVALTSPELQVANGEHLVVEFDHAHRFQDDVPGIGLVVKGAGVVQVSRDGVAWDEVPQGSFMGVSPAFPSLRSAVLDLGTSFGGDTVRVRFLVESSEQYVPVREAWYLDNIRFRGLATPPMIQVVPQVR